MRQRRAPGVSALGVPYKPLGSPPSSEPPTASTPVPAHTPAAPGPDPLGKGLGGHGPGRPRAPEGIPRPPQASQSLPPGDSEDQPPGARPPAPDTAPAPPLLPAPARVAPAGSGKPGRPGAATCAPGPAPCLRKSRSEPEAGPGPRAPQATARGSPFVPGSSVAAATNTIRSSRRRGAAAAASMVPPAPFVARPGPGRSFSPASLASPRLAPPPRRRRGLAPALCNCSRDARPLAARLPPTPPPPPPESALEGPSREPRPRGLWVANGRPRASASSHAPALLGLWPRPRTAGSPYSSHSGAARALPAGGGRVQPARETEPAVPAERRVCLCQWLRESL